LNYSYIFVLFIKDWSYLHLTGVNATILAEQNPTGKEAICWSC